MTPAGIWLPAAVCFFARFYAIALLLPENRRVITDRQDYKLWITYLTTAWEASRLIAVDYRKPIGQMAWMPFPSDLPASIRGVWIPSVPCSLRARMLPKGRARNLLSLTRSTCFEGVRGRRRGSRPVP
jgi:hypothetical protein